MKTLSTKMVEKRMMASSVVFVALLIAVCHGQTTEAPTATTPAPISEGKDERNGFLEFISWPWTPSTVASVIYSFCSFLLFIGVCVYAWSKMKKDKNNAQLSRFKRFTTWISLVWKMKSIYLSALVHIYDIGTDVGIIVEWGTLAFQERKYLNALENGADPENLPDGLSISDNVRGLNMMGLWGSSLIAFFLYRFISAGFVYEFTGKAGRAFFQFWDLEIYHAIYIAHRLEREEAGNLQRWLQKFEAIFESAPQALLQIVYIAKTADYGWLILSSIVLSFFSVAARFTSDDKIFFDEKSERLGLKWRRRAKKKQKQNDGQKLSQAILLNEANQQQQHGGFEQLEDAHHFDSDADLKSMGVLASTDSVRRAEATIDDEEEKETANTTKKDDDDWARWQCWKHIQFNREYLFRYSFRMCDVFSRLIILALIWSTLNGFTTGCILAFEVVTFVVYAISIHKYNFFQFLVATYFSEDDRNQTVTYCFFRRMESLIYLIIVSIVIQFSKKYNTDTTTYCYRYLTYDADWLEQQKVGCTQLEDCTEQQLIRACELDTSNEFITDRQSGCDCNLGQEADAVRALLIAAWTFASLSGSVFFGAINSMRKKFGTNERNIVNVMEKRDWEAFSEMLQFGYRMNRFDNKSQRTALQTYLDRIPSSQFFAHEVDRMVTLGADINDISVKPTTDFDDEPQADKIGDNVLIRYVKVTPCKEIDKKFDEVVKRWTADGVEVKDKSFDYHPSKTKLDINAKNNEHYTAFKIYWEKVQYDRRKRIQRRKDIEYDIKCKNVEAEKEDEEKDKQDEEEEKKEAPVDPAMSKVNAWFEGFYANILKWRELGADMMTINEDKISPLLTYIQDTDIKNIDMQTVKLLATNDTAKTATVNSKDEEEGKSAVKTTNDSKPQLIEMKSKDEKPEYVETGDESYLEREIKTEAFTEWMRKYVDKDLLFKVQDIQIWHELECTEAIKEMRLLSHYIKKCPAAEQTTDDIDILMQCGCDLEDEDIKHYPSKRPLPTTSFLERVLSKNTDDEDTEMNFEILRHLKEKYGWQPEREISTELVHDVETYETRFKWILQSQSNLTVQKVEEYLEFGFKLMHEGGDYYDCVRSAIENKDLPFEVLQYLLDNDKAEKKSDADEVVEEDSRLGQIFTRWLLINRNIEFKHIEAMIEKYHFSPFISAMDSDGSECAVHIIWQNDHLPLQVMHQFWVKYGTKKLQSHEGLYQKFLFYLLQNRPIKNIEEIQFLEEKFADCIDGKDKDTGNTILHQYVQNPHIEMDILRYLVEKHKELLHVRNAYDHHCLHFMAQNRKLKIEHLEYFVVELGVPMDTAVTLILYMMKNTVSFVEFETRLKDTTFGVVNHTILIRHTPVGSHFGCYITSLSKD